MLDELPETLDETYERVLKEINKAKREHARRLLQCITVAVRPLRIAELAEVLAVDFGTSSGGETSKLNPDWRWEDQEQAVLSTCSSLIAVVGEDEDQVVQFSLLCKRVPDIATVGRFKSGCLPFPHSPWACAFDPCKGLPGHSAALG